MKGRGALDVDQEVHDILVGEILLGGNSTYYQEQTC